MPYMHTGERIGYRNGKRDGESLLLSDMISQKFQSNPEKEFSRLKSLKEEHLRELGRLLFQMNSLDDVHQWTLQKVKESEE